MNYEEHAYRGDLFSKLLVRSGALSRIVAYCDGQSVEKVKIQDVESILRDFMTQNRRRKATYGLVLRNSGATEDSIRQAVSNTSKGKLTCVWILAVDSETRSFFGCHSVFKVDSTRFFEEEMGELLAEGFNGNGERKKYPPWFEFLFIKMNPIWALSVYNPQKTLSRLREES